MKNNFLRDLTSETARVKYACAKKCIQLSEKKPESLYPDLGIFISLLSGKNQILRWTALRVIGNLSGTDPACRIDSLIPKMIEYIRLGKLITAANAIKGLTEIARNRPDKRDEIIAEMLKIETYNYETPECQNVMIGNVIKALATMPATISASAGVKKFLLRAQNNPRTSVQKSATKLLQKIQTEAPKQ